MIPELPSSITVGVYGPVASGKTFMLKRWCQTEDRVLVFDPTMEFTGPEFQQILGSPKEVAMQMEELEKTGDPYKIAYFPRDIDEGFKWCTHAIWQQTRARYFFVEEVHELMSPWQRHEQMDDLIRYARKRLLGVVGSSQRIADVHKNFTANCRMNVILATSEVRDLDTIEERWGSVVRSEVEELKPLIYDDVRQVVSQIPEALVLRKGTTESEIVTLDDSSVPVKKQYSGTIDEDKAVRKNEDSQGDDHA